MRIGAQCKNSECTFTVWAPSRKHVAVHLLEPVNRTIQMQPAKNGYWSITVENCGHGVHYLFRLDDEVERPDPASYYQPLGVHGPSMVIDHTVSNKPAKNSTPQKLDNYIVYELHIGTFTPEGTFASAVPHIDKLADLGITAIEIMPVAQFPGERNWGYDGVYPFAVQNSYGGVDGLRQFVEACHKAGIAVILDVVYNHLGPEGNYLRDFGPYFTNRYSRGESINFDGPESDEVVTYFSENACYWLREFSIDALRLDAVHAICDMGARPFLQRLSATIEEEFRMAPVPRYLIAESDLNDGRMLLARDAFGMEMHAQWSDDFHHALHSLLTGERNGYYSDFGDMHHLVKVMKHSFTYAGDYSAFRKRCHGNDVSTLHTGKFVVCSQNHDQIGNRMMGERLRTLTDFNRAACAAASVLLSPFIPLLFMGEEHGETNPFLYFADHGDKGLVDAVREGRKREFAVFFAEGDPPDPFNIDTFKSSKINWNTRDSDEGKRMLRLYSDCIRVRASSGAIGTGPRENIAIHHEPDTCGVHIAYRTELATWLCLFNFGATPATLTLPFTATWEKHIDSQNYVQANGVPSLPDTIGKATNRIECAPYAFAAYKQIPTVNTPNKA